MEELKSAREETERTRKDVSAVDLRPGEQEGMQDNVGDGIVVGTSKSRAMEKRKRELEERRKIVDAKRRKVKSGEDASGQMAETNFESSVSTSPAVVTALSDPFATLEAQTHSVSKKRKGKGKAKADPRAAADNFLAQLEREMLDGKSK